MDKHNYIDRDWLAIEITAIVLGLIAFLIYLGGASTGPALKVINSMFMFLLLSFPVGILTVLLSGVVYCSVYESLRCDGSKG